VPSPVPRPETADQARTAAKAALALSRTPRAEDAARLLEAADALVLGAAGAVRGILRTSGRDAPWSPETDDGACHPLAREGDRQNPPALRAPDAIPATSDLSIPAAVLHRIPWCPIDRLPADGMVVETTAHARLAAAETALQIAPAHGLDLIPWIS